MTPSAPSLAQQLQLSTIRLESSNAAGQRCTGTGFMFAFDLGDGKELPLIITNRHVVEGYTTFKFVMTKTGDGNLPLIGELAPFTLMVDQWIYHPDPSIDLAAFPLNGVLIPFNEKGIQVWRGCIPERLIPSLEVEQALQPFEDITMIGYPNSIWDAKNNMPIARRGITATPVGLDYNGKSEFLIDCACFPGSSGSPVVIFNDGSYASGDTTFFGQRVLLLGVLFAGPQHFAEGEIKVVETQMGAKPVAISAIPNNLGFVVKARRILEFKDMFAPEALQQPPAVSGPTISTAGPSASGMFGTLKTRPFSG